MQKLARQRRFGALVVGIFLWVGITSSFGALAAPNQPGQSLEEAPQVIYLAVFVEGGSQIQLLPPMDLLQAASPTATIEVNYQGNWTTEAKAAFEYATGLWETYITSPVSILVDAYWENMSIEPYKCPTCLGGAGATGVRANFTGAPYSNTWYPIALANRLYGADLEPKTGDIKVTINSGFPDWYFGTDGKPPWNKYDFVSVVFHEIAHGLGFSGSTKVLPDSRAGSWGIGSATLYPLVYDQFVINGSGQKLIDSFPNNSKTLGDQLQSGNLYFKGKYAFAAGGSANPKIYAPPTWQQGSSFSHLDESTYPISSGNSLMTPSLANGEAVQVPGPITLGIFEDIGWTGSATIAPAITPVSPTATPRPVYSHFNYFPTILRSVQRGQ